VAHAERQDRTCVAADAVARESINVVYVVTRLDELGGAQIHVRDLATHMLAAGHRVAIVGGARGAFSDQLEALRIPFVEVPSLVRELAPHHDARALKRLRQVLGDLGPDLVTIHSSKAGVLARLAARSLRLPALFTAHGWAFASGVHPVRRILYRELERAVAPLADRIIVVSNFDRELALQARVAAPSRLRVVHNGIPPTSSENEAHPEREPVKLVMIARFSAQKDHRTLFLALRALADREWHLDLIGDGPLREEAQRLAESLGLARRISFLGTRTDVAELLAAAHAFLLISNWEGFPLTIVEAMRAGLPVIASDVGGCAEAVVDGVTGFVVPRADPGRLSERLRTLLDSPDLRVQLGKEGRVRYATRFTFAHMFEQTFAVYREAIERGGRHP
jgi:glycosyltransferase involved in cell wall biosynthesis